MRVTYDDVVFDELVNLSAYLAEDDESVAQTFLNACDVTFRFLALNPFIGSQREFINPVLREVRMWRVKGFEKYLIFYTPTKEGVRILHIFHSARDYNRIFDNP